MNELNRPSANVLTNQINGRRSWWLNKQVIFGSCPDNDIARKPSFLLLMLRAWGPCPSDNDCHEEKSG